MFVVANDPIYTKKIPVVSFRSATTVPFSSKAFGRYLHVTDGVRDRRVEKG